MKTASCLESFFSEQNTAIDTYFEERSSIIFEHTGGPSFVDIHVQSPDTSARPHDKTHEDLSDGESTTTPPSPVDHHTFGRSNPPRYHGRPGLKFEKLEKPNDIVQAASVSARLTEL